MVYYLISFFLIGTILGSFYNVVGYRLPKGESLIYPPSHCTKCNHTLKPWELIPIFSYLLQGGKCTSCKCKIAWFYPVFEASCGLLFMFAYLRFGISNDLIIALTFISLLIILTVSDYEYMVFPDSVLIFFIAVLLLEVFFLKGYTALWQGVLAGIISFVFMFLLKQLGDMMFKRESMGGGDIKLLFVFGLVLGAPNAILSVVMGSIVGLPLSLLIIANNKDHEIPFGPLLAIGALIVYLTGFDMNAIISLML